MNNFGHIHIHTEYSTLDGMCKLNELLQTAKNLGQKFIAVTDHGNTSAWWNAQKLGEKIGIKVLLGTEFYYERENDKENGHLVAIAKSNKGIENIFKLQEYAYVENFYRKPRINWEILKQHKEGLIITSACLASTFNQYIIDGKLLEASAWAKKFKSEFGEDFYIEIQANQLIEQYEANIRSIQIANNLKIKLIATNDVHYILKQDAFAHEVLLALQVNKKMSDEKRMKFDTQDFWLKSEEEMYQSFKNIPSDILTIAMNNTSEIADKCNTFLEKGNYLPKFYNIPKNENERSLLAKEINEGIKTKKYPKSKKYIEDVQHELDVIDRNGYSGYFLIVQDYVTTARRNGIVVGDGRGSGAGSKVAYLTDITRVEPSKYDLLFERFMADGRTPDL